MSDTDIRTALEQATGDLRTPPDLLDRVRAGGRRRVVQRRSVLAAGLATLAAGSTAGVALSGRVNGPVASPLLDRPTRGALKGDTAFLAQVRAVWRTLLGQLAPDGEAHVVWAGPVPARSRVAVVAQRVPEQADSAGGIRYGLTGFVELTTTGLRVISANELTTGYAVAPAALLGPDRDTVMVLDDGRRVRYSPSLSYDSWGKVVRAFTPLDFGEHDGVAFEAAETKPAVRMALRALEPDPLGDFTVGVVNMEQLAEDAAGGEPRADATRRIHSLPGAGEETAVGGLWDLETVDDYRDLYGYTIVPPADTWYVRGRTADRRPFVVQTLTSTDIDIRMLLSLGTPAPTLQGFTKATAPLPVNVRLPDRQGVVVAGPGRLRYRVSGGTWLPIAGNAALLPAAAAEVEVTPEGKRAVQVTL